MNKESSLEKVIKIIKKSFTQDIFDFNGKLQRHEFIWTMLANILLVCLFSVILKIISPNYDYSEAMSLLLPSDYLVIILNFAIWIPTISAKVRRFHDFGKSGKWILAEIIPLIIFFASNILYWKYYINSNTSTEIPFEYYSNAKYFTCITFFSAVIAFVNILIITLLCCIKKQSKKN